MSRVFWLALSSLVAVLIAAALKTLPPNAAPERGPVADTVKAVAGPELTGEAKIPAHAAKEHEDDLNIVWERLTRTRRDARWRKPVPPSKEQIQRALRSPVEIDFVDTPLRDGLSYLKDYHEIPIQVDERTLVDDGIAIDTPVTLQVEKVSLESALNLLLTPLQADYYIDDGCLRITTVAATNAMFSAEFYSIGDLVEGGFRADELQEILRPSLAVKKRAVSFPAVCLAAPLPVLPEPDEKPTLWVVGGKILIARAMPRGHRQLAQALAAMRAAMRQSDKTAAVVGPVQIDFVRTLKFTGDT